MTTTTATTRGTARNAQTARTRAAIVAAAREAFVARGYRATSLRDIAAGAGISHPGLLRHFATKDELLAEVVAALSAETEPFVIARTEAEEPGTVRFADIARHNAMIPGYLPLFAALTGEASIPAHPAHDRMRERYTFLRDVSTDLFEEAQLHDTVAPDREPRAEAVRIIAAWDGLQLLEQYVPGRVATADMLESHEALLALPTGWRDADDPRPGRVAGAIPEMPPLGDPDAATEVGYRVGRARRARIVADATALFAADGYGDTSLREIAAKVGVSKATLLHHYPSKEALLRAVLTERDRGIESRPSSVRRGRAVDELRSLPDGAAANAATAPGLIEVYAVLSCEAAPADHPAHDYFAERFATVLDHFTALLRIAQEDGDLPAHREPEFEAIWLVALWEGLQYQWLYDRETVDVAQQLAAHLDDVLPRG